MCELKTESDSDLQIGYGALDTRVDYAFPYKSGETVSFATLGSLATLGRLCWVQI